MRDTVTMQKVTCEVILGVFFSIFIAGVSSNFAQGLGHVLREEREQRDKSTRSHVYTNEDLSRSRIVIREGGEITSDTGSTAAAVSDEPATRQTLPRPSMIVWPSNIPLGDIARFYRRQRELESAKSSEFAVYEPPVLDMDFLLPSPLASPLPDFSEMLPALPSIPEPVWGQSTVTAEAVRVRRGDTLWKIAERHLGSGKDWGRIAAANPELTDPDQIQIGQQLRLPSVENSSSEKLVRVQPGDSLWKLATAQIGTGYAWGCLAMANPQIENVNRIYPGQLIVIPSNCSTGA